MAGYVTKTFKSKVALQFDQNLQKKSNTKENLENNDDNNDKFSINPFGGPVATNPFNSPFGGDDEFKKTKSINF